MINTQNRVLNSEAPVTPACKASCCKCATPATHAWPCVSETPEYYCQFHLEQVKHNLAVALGLAENRDDHVSLALNFRRK